MKPNTLILGLVAGTALAGCATDPRAYETAPVVVETPKGPVTCQLYTKELVMWDRAISAPRGMSAAEADAICEADGRRWAGS